ncbi:rCG22080, isoform CRA_c [Rattus norvegicus]|uniref:RCG22080, isoform CRA_c n=1 Tax=Rattus norvegicus TaxID=10116 RepID=A6K3V9_RAT|nr:rCG22080, isoform CRA_c [Rattus norvegicus]
MSGVYPVIQSVWKLSPAKPKVSICHFTVTAQTFLFTHKCDFSSGTVQMGTLKYSFLLYS